MASSRIQGSQRGLTALLRKSSDGANRPAECRSQRLKRGYRVPAPRETSATVSVRSSLQLSFLWHMAHAPRRQSRARQSKNVAGAEPTPCASLHSWEMVLSQTSEYHLPCLERRSVQRSAATERHRESRDACRDGRSEAAKARCVCPCEISGKTGRSRGFCSTLSSRAAGLHGVQGRTVKPQPLVGTSSHGA